MIVRYGVAIEYNQSVIRVILETTVGRIGDVACRIVGVILGGNHRITAQTPSDSLRNTIQIIISITEFGILVKFYFCLKHPHLD